MKRGAAAWLRLVQATFAELGSLKFSQFGSTVGSTVCARVRQGHPVGGVQTQSLARKPIRLHRDIPRWDNVRSMYRRAAALLALGSALVVTPLSPAAPRAGGTFRVAEPATYIDSIDGALATLAGDVPFLNAVCASLMRLPDKSLPAGFRVAPELAAGFPKISPDRKTYDFRIRKGLRFNTGARVTAADVAYTINRVLSPSLKAPGSTAFRTIVGAQDVLAGRAKAATGIHASGQRLTIRLIRPVGDFLENAASALCVLPAGLPLDPAGVTAPVPSPAPYYISEYVPGQRIVLNRNTYYRGLRPQHVDRFDFELTVDENEALDEVVKGTADYAFVPNPFYAARAPEFARRFGVNRTRFFAKPGNFLRLFVLNASRPLLRNNAPLRRAINFAIDRPTLVGVSGAYSGTPVDHYLPPIMPGYQKTHVYPLRRPDLAKARALANGHTRTGKLILYVPARTGAAAQAEIIKRDLKRIGLDVRVRSFPAGPGYFQKLATVGEPFDMGWIGWQFTVPDPGSALNGLFDGSRIGSPDNGNYSYFNSPRWNGRLKRASRLAGERRYRVYGRLDVALAREAAPAVAWAVDNALTLVSARTGCVIVNPYLDLDAVCLK
jgi:peptide/nickel transport system substrate-binding protein